MKNFLFVVNVDWFFCSHRLDLGKSLIRDGYKVHLATQVTSPELKNQLQNYGFIVHEIPIKRGNDLVINELRLLLSLCRLFKQLDPHIIHLVTIKPVLIGGIAARIVGSRSLVSAVSGLGYVFTSEDLFSKIRLLLVGVLYRLATNHKNIAMIFQNDDDYKVISKFNPKIKNQSFFIRGSGVNLNEFKREAKPSELFSIIMISRLLIDKGIKEYFEAAEIIKNSRQNIRFLLAGDIDLDNPNSLKQDELEALLKSGNIEYLGYQDNIPELLREVDVLCLPSYREGFPRVLIEGAASGKAIITTDIPGCRDAVIANKTGLLVPAKDSSALAVAMQKLIDDSNLVKMMGENARKLAEEKFDVEEVIKKHHEIYKKL